MAEERLNDRIAEDLKQYVNLHVDSAKLAMVEGLSSVAGGAIVLVICLFLALLTMMLLSGVLLFLLDMWLDSWVWSAAILAFAYMIAALLILKNQGPFKNRMVRVFAPMFFDRKDDDDDE